MIGTTDLARLLTPAPAETVDYQYGTVTAVSPLTVRVDSETVGVVTASVIAIPFSVNDRVLVLVRGADRTVIASASSPVTITPYARTLLDDADAPTARATLGVGGVWSSWSHNWTASGGGSSLGNGTASARYTRIVDSVTVQLAMKFGSTTNFGSGAFLWNLPVTAAIPGTDLGPLFTGYAYDSSANLMRAVLGYCVNAWTIACYVDNGGAVSQGTPWTWANADQIKLFGTYEAA
ncbi:MAG TPA: hypothetical protein PLV68_16145 [Ilumatobacteraceae bacterium]|nr:hypothetical protein [Ilumatobacteraceae bacterium]